MKAKVLLVCADLVSGAVVEINFDTNDVRNVVSYV